MAALKQLGLVLWKNFILRTRQPLVFLFEIIWPILIFLVVVLVRMNIEPEDKSECIYAPRANPSAGFQFLQDYACNIDNKCYASEEEASQSRYVSGASSFLKAVEPLYAESVKTQAFLNVLPDTVEVLDSLSEALEKEEIKLLIDPEKQPKVKDFFDDPDEVKRYLVEEGVLTSAQATDLMEATINITQLFQMTGVPDLQGIVCNHEQLGLYFTFPEGISVESVSDGLCAIDGNKTADITNFFVSQLSLSKTLRILRDFEEMLGDPQLADVFEAAAAMIDVLSESEILAYLDENWAWLRSAAPWVKQLLDFVEGMTNGDSSVDLALLGGVLEQIEPLFDQLGDISSIAVLRDIIGYFNTASDILLGQLDNPFDLDSISLGELLPNQTGLTSVLSSSLNISTDVAMQILSLNLDAEKLTQYISQLSSGVNASYLLCVEPGLASILTPDSDVTAEQLLHLQETVCKTNSTEELVNMLGLEQLIEQFTARQDIQSFNWTSLLQNSGQLVAALNDSLGALPPMLDIFRDGLNLEDLYHSLASAAGAFLNLDTNSNLLELVPLLSELGGMVNSQQTEFDLYGYIAYTMVDIFDKMADKIPGSAYVLADLMSESADLRAVIESVLVWQPDQAPVILARLFDPIRLQSVFESGTTIDSILCDPDSLAEFLDLDAAVTNVTFLSGILCDRDLDNILMTLADSFELDDINEQFNTLLLVIEGKIVPNITIDYAALSEKIMALQTKLSDQVIAMVFMEALEDAWEGLDVNEAAAIHWVDFLNQFALQYPLTLGGSLLDNLGGQLEERDTWYILAPWIKATLTLLKSVEVVVNSLSLIRDENTESGRITRMAVLYLPEMLYEIAETLNSSKSQMFLAELSSDPVGLFCDYDKMELYLEPTERLPLEEILTALCNLDVEEFQAPFVDAYVEIFYNIEMMSGYISLTKGDVYDKDIDWWGLYQRGQVLTITVSRFALDPSAWSLFMGFDHNRANEAGVLLLQALMNIEVNQAAGLAAEQDKAFMELLAGMVDVDMFTYYMLGIQWYTEVLNKYLETGDDGLTLSELLGNSSWLEGRVNDLVDVSPDLVDSLSTAILKPEQLMMLLLTTNLTGQELCTDVTLNQFLTLTDPTQVENLEALLCDVQTDDLLQALMGSGVLQDITEVTTFLQEYDPSKIPANMSFSFSEIMETIQHTVELLTAGLNNTESLELLLFPELLNTNVGGINSTGRNLIDSLMGLNMNDLASWAALSSQMLSLLGGQTVPEIEPVLYYSDALVDLGLRSLIFLAPDQFSPMFPLLSEFLPLANSLPEIMSAAALTATQAGSSSYASLIVSNPALLCNVSNLDAIITLPPNSSIDLAAFQKQFCSLNMTALMLESNALYEYVAGPLIAVITMPESLPPVNMTAFFMKQALLQQEITRLASQNIEESLGVWIMALQWINGDLWESQAGLVLNTTLSQPMSSNPSDYASIAGSLESLSSMLNFPELNKQLNLVLAILQQVNEKLSLLQANSSLAEMFPSSPELAKLARMMEEFPYVLELFLSVSSSPTPQFLALLTNPNTTAVLITICHPLTEIQEYFPEPEGWSASGLSVEALRDRFCQVDFVTLQQEIYQEFNIVYIMEEGQNANSVNWTSLYIHVDQVINNLMRVIVAPPIEFQSAVWQNTSFWMSTLLASSGIGNEQDAMSFENYQGLIELMYGVLGNDSSIITDFAGSINKVTQSINQQIALLTKPDLSLYDVFSDSPEVLALLNASLGYSNEALSSVLGIPFSNPLMLLQLQSMSSDDMCNQPLSYYKETFAVTDDQVAENLRSFVCNLNSSVWEDIQNELAEKVGLAELLALSGFNTNTSTGSSGINGSLAAQLNWAYLAGNLTELGVNVESLMAGFNAEGLMPQFSQSELEKLIEGMYTNISVDNIDSLLPAFMAGLAPLYGTEAWDMVSAYQQALDAVVQYLNDMLAMLTPNGDGTVDIQTLFGGAEQWNQLLQTAFSEVPDLLPSLAEITLNNDKVTELVTLDEQSLSELLCSEEQMRKFFVFPDSVNVGDIVNGVCGLNATLLLQEFHQTFQIMGLIERITNPVAGDVDIEDMIARYTQFIIDITALTNITDFAFFNQTIGQFIALDFTSLTNTDELLAYLASMNGVTTSDAFVMPTTMEGLLDFIFETLVSTAAGLGTQYQDDGTNAILKLLDVVMKTLAEKLDMSNTAELTLGSLVGNIDELELVLESVLELEPEVIVAILNSPLPSYAVLELVMAGEAGNLGSIYCHPNITSLLPPSINGSADDLIEMLCELDYEALWSTMQAYINYDEVMQLVTQAINPTSMFSYSTFNWTEYAENFDSWKSTIDRLGLALTNPSDDLSAAFSPERLWAFAQALLQTQATATIQSTGFDFLGDLPPLNWEHMTMLEIGSAAVLEQLQMLRDSGATLGDLLTDSSLLTHWYTRLTVFINGISSALPFQADTEMYFDSLPINKTEFSAIVCDVNNLTMVLITTAAEYELSFRPYWDMQKVSDVLCNQTRSQWWEKLTEDGFAWNDIHDMAYLLSLHSGEYFERRDKGWSQVEHNLAELSRVLTDLDDLTQTLSNFTEADIAAFLNGLNQAQLESAIPLTIESLRSMSHLNLGPPGLLAVMTYTMDYLSTKLEHLLGNGSTIALGELFSSEDEARRRLSTMLSEESVNDLLSLTMNSAVLLGFDNAWSWQQFVCNTSAFHASVDMGSVTDPDRLQRELCEAARNGTNVLEVLLQLMEVDLFLAKVGEISQREPSEDPFEAFEAQLRVLLGNIGRIQGVEEFMDMDAWMGAFQGLANSQLPQLENPIVTGVCDIAGGVLAAYLTEGITMALTLNQEYMETFLMFSEILPSLANLTCDLPNLGLAQLFDYYNTTKLLDFTTHLMLQLRGTLEQYPRTYNFDCASYMETVNRYAEVVSQDYTSLDTQLGVALECLARSADSTIPSLGQIDWYMDTLFDLQNLLYNVPEWEGLLDVNTASILDFAINQIVEREDVLVSFTDVLSRRGNNTFEELLQQLFSLSVAELDAVLNSTISGLTLFELWDLSDEQLGQLLCTPGILEDILMIPSQLVNVSSLSAELCQNENLTQLLQEARSGLDIGKIFYEISTGVSGYTLNTDWIYSLVEGVTLLSESSEDLFGLMDSLGDVNLASLQNLIPVLLEFYENDSTDQIFAGLESIISSLEDIEGTDEALTATVLRDLTAIVEGLKGLKFFGSLSVAVEDVLTDPVEVQRYMTGELGLEEDVAQAILKAELTAEAMLNFTGLLDLGDVVCDTTALADIITLRESSPEEVTSQLCGLDEQQVEALAAKLLEHLSLGEFVMQVLSISPDEILDNAGVDKDMLMEVFEAFLPLQQNLEQFAININNLSANLLGSTAQLQQGDTSTFRSLSQVLCGRDDAFDIEDEFQLGSSDDSSSEKKRKKRQTDEERIWEDYERSKFDTPFCKAMYDELISTDGGRIIWSFLKPLLIGQIPFTPDNIVTRAIMEEAVSIFDLGEIQDFAKSFIDGAKSIKQISGNQEQLDNLEEALDNPIVNTLVAQVVGVNPSSFTGSLNILSAIDEKQLDAIVNISTLMMQASECVYEQRLASYDSEESLEVKAKDLALRNELFAAVVFLDMDDVDTNYRTFNICNSDESGYSPMPKHIKFKIRMDSEDTPATSTARDGFWMPSADDSFAEDLRYFRGFIQMQDLVEDAALTLLTGCDGERPIVESQQFPHPCHEDDVFQRFVGLFIFPILMVLSQLVVVAVSIKNVVYDKEHRLEETMKAMGLRGGVNWVGWFLNTYIMMLITDVIIVLFLHFGGLFRYSDFGLLFVYLALFSFSTLMLCYLVSVFFFRTTLAALVGLIVYLVSYVPYIVLANLVGQGMEFWQIFCACLSTTTAFSFGTQMIAQMELRSVGMQWSDISNTRVFENFSFAWVYYMMLIDSAIYILLAWYFGNVLPGKYGVRQPFYFFLLPSYWGCGCTGKSSKYKPQKFGGDSGNVQGLYKRTTEASSAETSTVHNPSRSHDQSPASNQTVPEEIARTDADQLARLPVGVSLHNLSKTFKSKKCLVNLNVNFHQEQITAFLGQNGAGKTTTVNLLTGLYEPSSGDAFVSSKSILTEMGNIRRNLGVCPQHDVLFEYLTVREHLEFFASLKGHHNAKEMRQDINRMIEQTGLDNHAKVKVSQLSGGQRRRLSVALAFIGGSKVIILDEPTSGIDPCARRNIWDLITQNRVGRTIILSTHHMDEADLLADRIVLLHKGCVLTTGSPLYLKSQYGSGYNLIISKDVASNAPHHNNANNGCDPSAITSFLSQYVPDAQLVEEVGTEMTFMLPTHQGQLARFPEMFADFEKQKYDLGVSSYGVSDTTLEEVFLKLTMSADNQQSLDPDQLRQWHLNTNKMETGHINGASGHTPANGTNPSDTGPSDQPPSSSRHPSLIIQMLALFYKRFLHHARDFRSYLSQIILPVLFILLAMGMTIIVPNNDSEPQLLLVPDLHEDTNTFYRIENPNPLFKEFERSMLNSPWLGTTCVLDDKNHSQFCDGAIADAEFVTDDVPANKYELYDNPGECMCEENRHECPEGAGGLPPPHKTLGTGLEIYNLTGNQFEVQDYLLRTYTEFIQERYGGFSFIANGDELHTKVWYNNKGFHSLPAFQNAYVNTLLRTRVATQPDAQQYGISVHNHPLKLDKETLSEMTLLQSVAQTGLALVVLCAFCFIPAGYTIYLVSERVTHEKQLQMIYGVGSIMYWIVAIIWDMLTFSFSVGLAVMIARAFNIDIYTDKENLGAFAVSLLMFGWSCIPLMYLLSRFFTDVSTAYIVIFLINFLIGLITVCCTFLLSLFLYIDEIKDAHQILSHVFKIFPQFCLGDALVRLSRNQFIANIYETFNINKYEDPYSYEMIAWHLIAMAIQGVVFYILNLMLEIRCRKTRHGPDVHGNKSPYRLNHTNKYRNYKEDDDVSLERQRVTTGDARSDLLVLHDLSKMYRRGFKKVRAVNDLSLGIPRGECFGLLGVNGAGKTTTFNMITSDISPTRGVALLNGRVISEDAANMNGQVGYCPQFDALDKFLTGRQLLYFYSLVKGVTNSQQVIDYLVKRVGLESHQNRLIKTYSGGTRRKLSTAIALLGNPELILMDEPTTGMDASSRRKVWTSIQEAVRHGSSVVLTSHSMMECDALCTRMAVMVNGRFRCLGNSQHLKSTFGTGYTVVTRVSGIPPDLQKVIDFMVGHFDGCFLKDFHLNQLEFEIPSESVSLAHVFGRLEAEKSMLHIQEYSVSQPTLEQVFISFAKHQHDGEETEVTEGPTHAYNNLGYGTISSLGRGAEVRKSLKSIPGYDSGLVKPDDVKVDVVDDDQHPSSSRVSSDHGSEQASSERASSSHSGSVSPASTLMARDSAAGSDEVAVVDPVTGETHGVVHQDGNTTVVQL